MRMAPRTLLRCLGVALIAGVTGCASLPRPSGPHGPSQRDALLLDAEPAANLLIEVDRVEGTSPRPRSLAILLRKSALYLDKPGRIELVVDDVIPAERWQAEPRAIVSLGVQTRSLDRPPEDTAHVHILYAPEWARFRGYAWTRHSMERFARSHRAPLVIVLQDRLRSIAWITGAKQESSVLVHELGHTLGLATDPGHSSGAHCTNAWCLMYDGVDARTFALYFFPTLFTGYLPLDFCGDCRDDLYEDHDGVPPGRR